ncbi:HD-GYP domain-containing protein [Balneatrix alpica]|uniref:HD-GYP domain-containing protein n=1 Tax=Balneatrix alpica TaxID=75684 RepID=A0ABV5Z9P1_9GAMM|nr:HD domain-containing phosphohydrolase [Balneatrix alpica]
MEIDTFFGLPLEQQVYDLDALLRSTKLLSMVNKHQDVLAAVQEYGPRSLKTQQYRRKAALIGIRHLLDSSLLPFDPYFDTKETNHASEEDRRYHAENKLLAYALLLATGRTLGALRRADYKPDVNTLRQSSSKLSRFEFLMSILEEQINPAPIQLEANAEQSSRNKLRDFDSELVSARAIHQKAVSLIKGVSLLVANEEALDLDPVFKSAELILRSLNRNPDALVCVGRLRSPDNYLFEHSVNVSILLGLFGLNLNMKPVMIRDLIIGGLLHDIGMMRIPAHIRDKQGQLSSEELALIRRNPILGEQILSDYPQLNELTRSIAAQQYENYDGSGYPNRLKGKRIGLYGRMTAIINAYDAMTVDRCYKNAKIPAAAIKTLLQAKGSRYDPELLLRFITLMGIFPLGSLVELKSGRLGFVLKLNDKTRQPSLVRCIYHAQKRMHLPPEDVWLETHMGSPAQDAVVAPVVNLEALPELDFNQYL